MDYQHLVKTRLEKILREGDHLPNNVVPALSKVGLSQSEIDEIKNGKPFPAWRFIPWVLDHLGYELMKRPPPPPPCHSSSPLRLQLIHYTHAHTHIPHSLSYAHACTHNYHVR